MAVLVSGSGSNLQALIDSAKEGYFDADIVLVISNNSNAFGLERAKKANIVSKVVSLSDFESREIYDKELIKVINEHDIDLVVLAGYMLICSEAFVDGFYGRLINLHPSLLPSFAGADGIGDALNYGAKITGVTVHFVDKGCDTGPVIMQEAIEIKEGESKENLAEKIHKIEHKLLPKAVKYFVEGKLKLEGRKVSVF
ncbi:MAG: phosphoribosylglycinamide formyltransferase [Actinobacteria bacterium]|nr:MAG: phosphoribosylglycinamide formyltransferase [Actinomycetota bacterium]